MPEDEDDAIETRDVELPGYRDLAVTLAPALEHWRSQFLQFRSEMDSLAASIGKRLAPQMRDWVEKFEPLLQQMRKNLPPNWPHGEVPFRQLADLGRVDELPTVWVPSASILRQLAAAKDLDARREILGAARTEVVADCLAVAAEITSPTFETEVAAAREAANALGENYVYASQALSASLLSGLTVDRVASTLAQARKYVDNLDARHVGLVELGTLLALLPLRPALSQFRLGTPPPVRFNRHATAHGVYAVHYTEANAALALLTSVSLLRQAAYLESQDTDESNASSSATT